MNRILSTRRRERKTRENGAALLTVLVAMMIITIMLFEFQYASMVERQLAFNDINQMQAYYLAKSGARIGLLRISLYGRAKRSPQVKQLGAAVEPFLDAIWNLPLPAFPPEKSVVAQLDGEAKQSAEKTLKETHVTDGTSTHVITSEASKINLNFLEVPTNARNRRIDFARPDSLQGYVGKMVVSLIDNMIKDSEDPNEEFGNLKPDELVMNIMDWISPGSDKLAGGAKDAFYEQQQPPYKAKRARFYTLDEVKLVQGMDDHLFMKMKPYLTVYSYDGKININSASNTVLRALYSDFTEDDIKRINEKKEELGGAWGSEKQFVDYIAGDLNRPQFKSIYNDDKNYPFTTKSESFLIESLGMVKKSASSVQKVIRVGVAFTSGKGGTANPSLTTKAACEAAPGMAWHEYTAAPGSGKCLSKPKDDATCTSLGGGPLTQRGNQKCCIIPNTMTACLTPQDEQAAKDATAMKVLYWNET